MDELAIIAQKDQTTMREIVDMVLDGLNSEHSKRSCEKALEDFLYWWSGEGKPAICKAVVQKYKTMLLCNTSYPRGHFVVISKRQTGGLYAKRSRGRPEGQVQACSN